MIKEQFFKSTLNSFKNVGMIEFQLQPKLFIVLTIVLDPVTSCDLMMSLCLVFITVITGIMAKTWCKIVFSSKSVCLYNYIIRSSKVWYSKRVLMGPIKTLKLPALPLWTPPQALKWTSALPHSILDVIEFHSYSYKSTTNQMQLHQHCILILVISL